MTHEVNIHSSNTQAQLKQLLSTVNHIALVGASPKPERPSHEVMEFLLNKGFHVTPINPGLTGEKLLNQTVVESVSALKKHVDMVEIFRNSEAAGAIAQEILALPESLRPGIVWMQIGVVNIDAAQALEEAGITVVMDQCPKRVLSC